MPAGYSTVIVDSPTLTRNRPDPEPRMDDTLTDRVALPVSDDLAEMCEAFVNLGTR